MQAKGLLALIISLVLLFILHLDQWTYVHYLPDSLRQFSLKHPVYRETLGNPFTKFTSACSLLWFYCSSNLYTKEIIKRCSVLYLFKYFQLRLFLDPSGSSEPVYSLVSTKYDLLPSVSLSSILPESFYLELRPTLQTQIAQLHLSAGPAPIPYLVHEALSDLPGWRWCCLPESSHTTWSEPPAKPLKLSTS